MLQGTNDEVAQVKTRGRHMSRTTKARLRPRSQTDNVRRQQILDMAAKLFSTNGYGATSLRDVATACDMKAGSLYYYFRSKDEIVAEVLRIGVKRVFDKVRYEIALLPRDAAPHDVIRTAIRAHLTTLLRLHDYTSANVRIFGQVPVHIRRKLIALRDAYEVFWVKLLQRCARSGQISPERNLHLCRLFLISAMNGCLEWYREGSASLDSICDELAGMFLSGIAAPPSRKVIRRRTRH